jgi:Ca-activated chloride channel family protein
MSRRRNSAPQNPRNLVVIAVVLLGTVLILCVGVVMAANWLPGYLAGRTVTLDVACSPEKQALFEELVDRFSATRPKTPQGKRIKLEVSYQEPEPMIEAASTGTYDAITPDSTIWLTHLDRMWQDGTGTEANLVGETARYAVSPVIIAMWEDVAQSMGYPDRSLSWSDLLAKAQSDPDFKWSHPSTGSASGLLATLAEFYAGSGKTRGLTKEDVTAESTLAYVAAIEKTVRYYGEGEGAVIEQVLEKGPSYLDAFVVQEQLVIYFNARSDQKLVAVYPLEGTLWEDHPIAFLERPDVSSDERLAFTALKEFLQSRDSQMLVLEHGYRPIDLSISLDDPASPIRAANGVDPTEPQTALQVPSAAVIDVVRDVWWYTKRHTNVYLIADVSGSMEGKKLADAQEALLTFVAQIRGSQERVGLIEFASQVNELTPLSLLESNRGEIQERIRGLVAEGNTALLDAVDIAYTRLQGLDDRERINAIVVMTDGKENNSHISLRRLSDKLRRGNETGVPIVVFCVAYGGDADMDTLETIAEATGGQTREGDPQTIEELYKILSSYF